MKSRSIAVSLAALWACGVFAAAEEQGWIELFDGKSLKNWKASEGVDSWRVEDGCIVGTGRPRSHLFYVGPEAPFKNFVLKVDCWTKPGSNSGIYFHTRYQPRDWPAYGYEAQVNNSHADWRRTGSLYGVVNVPYSLAKDGQWWTQTIIVRGKRIVIKVNDQVVVDYTEPPKVKGTRRLSQGTIAFQAHDPTCLVKYRNIRILPLD